MTGPAGGCLVQACRANRTCVKCMTELIEPGVLMQVRDTRLPDVTPLFVKMETACRVTTKSIGHPLAATNADGTVAPIAIDLALLKKPGARN